MGCNPILSVFHKHNANRRKKKMTVFIKDVKCELTFNSSVTTKYSVTTSNFLCIILLAVSGTQCTYRHDFVSLHSTVSHEKRLC